MTAYPSYIPQLAAHVTRTTNQQVVDAHTLRSLPGTNERSSRDQLHWPSYARHCMLCGGAACERASLRHIFSLGSLRGKSAATPSARLLTISLSSLHSAISWSESFNRFLTTFLPVCHTRWAIQQASCPLLQALWVTCGKERAMIKALSSTTPCLSLCNQYRILYAS